MNEAPRTLLVIGDAINDDVRVRPRRDYEALRDALDADILDAGSFGDRRGRGRSGIALARLAAKRAPDYDHVYCDSEHIGMPLAFLLRNRPGTRLTMIAHYLTPLKKRLLFSVLGLQRRIDGVAVHSPAQAERARSLRLEDRQLWLVPYQVDAAFWRPDGAASGGYIASAGQEFRDYRTLVSTADGLGVRVEIAAGSHWSSRKRNVDERALPAGVTMRRRPYGELREMYAGSAFVVVPLHDVDFQAGIITILEAMAMGKAVVVSRTRGQTGVVSGPMMADGTLREIGEDAWPEPTGIYVPPGDAGALRQAITYLLERPDVAARMGAAARRHVESDFSLEHFVRRMTEIIAPSAARARRLELVR